jgi:uncharacterized protein YndB with AHSA1/START domain
MTQSILVRRIAARPGIVFEALVSADGIASWWGPDDLPVLSAVADPRVGGSFCVRFRTVDGREHECAGEFLQIDRPTRVVMSWRWAVGGTAAESGTVSRLEFRLRPIDTGTELTLLHSALSSEASARSHAEGWSGAVAKLQRQFPGSERACRSGSTEWSR